jgi:PhoH-like ATPase
MPMGRDIGYLPGSKEEKLEPWFSPIRDNMSFLFGGDEYHIDEYIERKIIEIEAPTYIRGRSIQNAFMLIDETQNLNRNEMKTIMTRVGYNTKIVLTGDLSQIDNINLDEYSSGLTHLIEKLKHSDLSGHIYLSQGERSEVATLCAENL